MVLEAQLGVVNIVFEVFREANTSDKTKKAVIVYAVHEWSAAFSFVGVFALIAHLIADISYSYLDPRIRIKSQG